MAVPADRIAWITRPWRALRLGDGFARRGLTGIVAGACLAACSSAPELSRPELGPRSERTVYAALDQVQSTDDERLRVLQAYDASNEHLRDLVKQSRDLLHEWDQLDRLAPDFPAKVDALAVRWAALNADEMKTRGSFERNVSTILTPKQWESWQKFMRASRRREEENESERRNSHGF